MPKQLRKRIIFDTVNPTDLNKNGMVFGCEACTHYNSFHKSCMNDFKIDLHTRAAQLRQFETHGRMAICRFHEID